MPKEYVYINMYSTSDKDHKSHKETSTDRKTYRTTY